MSDKNIDSVVDFLRKYTVPLELAKKMLEPYPDKWIEWSNNGYDPESKKVSVSPYVSGARVLVHLNSIFGPGGWSFTVNDIVSYAATAESVDGKHVPHHMLGAPLYMGVSGCFKALDFPPVCDVGEDFATWGNLNKSDYSAGKALKKPASLKNAQTDAIKRSVRNYGIGLYMWLTPTLHAESQYKVPDAHVQKVQGIGRKIKTLILREVYGEVEE